MKASRKMSVSSIISYFTQPVIGSFMNIDDESYKVRSIQTDFFKFGGIYDVVFRINLENKKKEQKTLYFTETRYWLQGNQHAQKAISELKYEVIADMTDELFYEKPAEKTYVYFDWSNCVPSRDK